MQVSTITWGCKGVYNHCGRESGAVTVGGENKVRILEAPLCPPDATRGGKLTFFPSSYPGWKTNVLPFLLLPGAGRGGGDMNKASIMLAGSLVLPMARASAPNGEAEAQRC